MNKGEWTNKEKLKSVKLNREERQNLMKKIKQRWHIEFPQKKRAAQNLVDNARRFEKKSLGPGGDAYLQAQKNMDWINEMKVKIDDEERTK